MKDIFLFDTSINITSYADDNTPYAMEKDTQALIYTLENDTSMMMEWFRINEMKSNSDKCHLIIANETNMEAKIGNDTIKGTDSVKLLGITIDNKLKFSEHVSNLCKKANQKLHALARVSTFMNKKKLRMIMKSFIMSQFNYCPLIWMFHSRTLNNRINRIHERALKLVYKDSNKTFIELLEKDESFSIHQRNLQKLATEMYKIKNNLSPILVSEIFQNNQSAYSLRKNRYWNNPNVRTVYNGTETISYRGPKTWELVPLSIRNIDSLPKFKIEIKKWKSCGCQYRLCRPFIPELGFL